MEKNRQYVENKKKKNKVSNQVLQLSLRYVKWLDSIAGSDGVLL